MNCFIKIPLEIPYKFRSVIKESIYTLDPQLMLMLAFTVSSDHKLLKLTHNFEIYEWKTSSCILQLLFDDLIQSNETKKVN